MSGKTQCQSLATKRYTGLSCFLSSIAIVATVASQFVGGDLLVIYGPLWVAVAMLGLNECGSKTVLSQFALFFLLVYLILGFACSVLYLSSGENGYISNIFLCLTKTLLMYLVGTSLSSFALSNEKLLRLSEIYIMS